MKKIQNSLKKNNKGFTLASLLIIMLLASVLAILLMTITVLNVQSKQVDRKSKQTFYLSESIVDEIKAGIEAELGDALGTAYAETLPNLGKDSIDDLEIAYSKKIISVLFKKYTNNDFTETYGNNMSYKVDILKGYLSDKNSDKIKSVELITDSKSVVYVEDKFTKLTLKQLGIKYTTTDGYQSSMQMDFVVQVPNTRFENPGFYLTLGDYAIITDDYLTNKVISTINGSVYAGKGIESEGSGSILNFSSDDIVTRNSIAAINGGTINMKGLDEACSIWAKAIKTANIPNSKAEDITKLTIKNGKCYVKNDLVLDAKINNYVSIEGEYYGFGSSNTIPDESSAILINGRKSTLDLTGVSNMMLAGRAFVDVDSSNPNSGVLMGESLSVKGNQVAYLIPEEYIRGGSNPTTKKTNLEPDDIEVDFRPTLTRDFSNKDKSYDKYLETYKTTYDKVEEEIENGSILQYLNLDKPYKKIEVYDKMGQQETYYYLQFRSEKLANKYFNDYYKNNKDRIDERTRLYADSIKLNKDYLNAYSIVGNLVSYSNTDKEANVFYKEEPASVAATCNLYENQYKNMIYNLYKSGSTTGAIENTSLFDKYIDITQFNKDETAEVFVLDSNTKAIFVNNTKNAFNISSQFTGDGSGIIVATGNVIVDKNFKGTIIAKGKITFQGANTLTADKYTVYQLLVPLNPEVIKYFKELNSSMASGTSGAAEKINIHELVNVKNWKRN